MALRDLILPAGLTFAVPALAWALMGPMPLAVFAFAFGGGFAVYALTLWRRPIDARPVLVPYLITVILFILHVWEEYLTDFEQVISALGHRMIPEEAFMSVAAFLAPAFWIAGALLILSSRRFGDYFLCVLFFAMVAAELSHFAFPFLIDGTFHYESGMYTAALPLFPAAWGAARMVRLWRRAVDPFPGPGASPPRV